MARYQVIIAYDGTEFFGFQKQAGRRPSLVEPKAGGARTVQSVVETALSRIGWQGKSILAAGRTDTGVHASGQVIAFDLEWKHPPVDLQSALNAALPPDVAARQVREVQPDFHPRFEAVSRRYRYRIFCEAVRNPLMERYAWRVWPPVAPSLLQQSVESLSGWHDFAAFGSPPRPGGSTVRTVLEASWQLEGAAWVFQITADAFLYHMVRRIVFAQVAIGQGKLPVDAITRRLDDPGAEPPLQGLAPPNGLALVEVYYS